MTHSYIAQTLFLGLVTLTLTARISPHQLLDTLRTRYFVILLAACAQLLLAPLVLFFFLAFTTAPVLEISLINLVCVPSFGIVAYFVMLARGALRIALWSSLAASLLASIFIETFLQFWLVSAPELRAAAPDIAVQIPSFLGTVLWAQAIPMAIAVCLRLLLPTLMASMMRWAPHIAFLLVAAYPILTLPIAADYSQSSITNHLLILLFLVVVCLSTYLLTAALRMDRSVTSAFMLLVPYKISVLPQIAPYIASTHVQLDPSLLQTWTAMQFLLAAGYCVWANWVRRRLPPPLPPRT